MAYKAPKRTAGKIKADIVNEDFYSFYKEQLIPVESISGGTTLGSYDLTPRQHGNILKDINREIIRLMITENFEFKLPYGMGTMSIVQKKVKLKLDKDGNLSTRNLTINYKETLDLWNKDEDAKVNKSLVFHTNDHNDGYKLNYFWSKRGSKCRGIECYYFIACREMKRAPKQIMEETGERLTFYERPEKLRRLPNPKYINNA